MSTDDVPWQKTVRRAILDCVLPRLGFLFLLTTPPLLSCIKEQPGPIPLGDAGLPESSPEFINTGFSEVYQLFLKRYVAPKLKIARWDKSYQHRWVRWTGQLVAVTATGVKIRQLASTVTFDISVQVNQPQLASLSKLLTVGKFYTYIGRLDSYDDLFRSLRLDQGSIVNPNPEGVPGELVPIPPPLPRVGYEDEPPGSAPWVPGDPEPSEASAPPATH